MNSAFLFEHAMLHDVVGSTSDCRSRDHKFDSQLDHIAFMETHNEIPRVILPFPLIQEGQLSVTDRYVKKYWLTAEGLNLRRKSE